MLAKILHFVKAYNSELILVVAITSITIISFNLGRMSMRENEFIESPSGGSQRIPAITNRSDISQTPRDPTVVASKASSAKLYHFTWCSGAGRITAKNKISFANEAAAIAAGYSLAGNCQK